MPALALPSGPNDLVCLTLFVEEAACRLFRRTALTVMKGMQMASKKTPHEFTSARVASKAGKLLSNPKTPANVKSVAAPR